MYEKKGTVIRVGKKGYFGEYGGRFVPEVLNEKLENLAKVFDELKEKKEFNDEFKMYLKKYVGRPSPIYYAKNLSKKVGSKIYLKREDLNHTGAHKINNTIGQILIARHMGAKEIIAETGAGQHGVATATAAALFGMKCKIFMGAEDVKRQAMNVERIKILGAELFVVKQGTETLKDAVDAALGYYVENPESYYLLGSAVGPDPYPTIVRHFQSVIGEEARRQILEDEGRLPDSIFACIGGGSNAIGIFSAFLEDEGTKLYAAEGGGEGLILGKTAATLNLGRPKVFQGSYSYCLLDDADEPVEAYSISAGLDYPGVGPEHSFLKDAKRVEYHSITDTEAVEAFKMLAKTEGIIPAIESAHAVALATKLLKNKDKLAIINISGRGDKDVGRF
ncbi:MAG: tryptophan synthase subunit beta [Fusobacteriia bacterium 4572_132]|nr:MAG: tryptophan synthase subunit beta [Fusobacteriia bacterium 4572_132]